MQQTVAGARQACHPHSGRPPSPSPALHPTTHSMQTEENASGLCSRAMSKLSYTFCCSMADIRRACRWGRRAGPVGGEKVSQ